MFGREKNNLVMKKGRALERRGGSLLVANVLLHVSRLLFFGGVFYLLLNSLNMLMPSVSFEENAIIRETFFNVGITINLVLIPLIYITSYFKFEKRDRFWQKQAGWILPLFFAGIFFQYISHNQFITSTLYASFAIAIVCHALVMIFSEKKSMKDFEGMENKQLYMESFVYLAGYYFVFAFLIAFFDAFVYLENMIIK